MSFLETATVVLAQGGPPPGDPGGQGEDFGKSSPVGLLLLVLFGIAVAFLIRSMSRHLKKLPTNFDEERAAAAAPARARRAEEAEAAAAEEEASDAEGSPGEEESLAEDKDKSSDGEQVQPER